MAEALAVIGSVASIMQLTGEAVKLMTRLRHFIRVLHKAPEEVESFLMETSIYTGMLNFFTELASRAMKTKGRKKQGEREKLVSNIVMQCKTICHKMKNLVNRFSKLANGNLTRLENILERIKYILDKPDVTDLRLSVKTVSTIVNTLTTLFLLESSMEKKDDKTAILLEQVKNLLCTVKKANIELANHRQSHPLAYESGEPDNVMIDVSKEIQRQISSEIKSYSRFETAPDRRQRPRERRRDSSVIDRLDDQRRWVSPSRRSGSDTESIGNLPQRPAYRTSFQSSSNAMERDAETRNGSIFPKPLFLHKSPSLRPPVSETISELRPGKRWPDKSQAQANAIAREGCTPEEHFLGSESSRDCLTLDILDPMRPQIHPCNRRTHVNCSLCGEMHCPKNLCPPNKQTTTPIVGARNSHVDTSSSLETPAQHSPSTTMESEEQIDESERGAVSPKNGWSRTSLAPQSSKSSNPTTEGSRLPDAKNQDSIIAAHTVADTVEEIPDPGKCVPHVLEEKQTQSQPKARLEQVDHKIVREGPRWLEDREIRTKEERRRSDSASHESRISDDSDSMSGKPSPYRPVPPFGGPGSRRRPRRPRPEME